MTGEKSRFAVAFVRPRESQAGHPANATAPDYEKFVALLIAKVKNNPELWKKTAILVTTDEGGGYYDSGYVQPVDFFGDSTRIPPVGVFPYARKGYVDHTYHDNVSISNLSRRMALLHKSGGQALGSSPGRLGA